MDYASVSLPSAQIEKFKRSDRARSTSDARSNILVSYLINIVIVYQ